MISRMYVGSDEIIKIYLGNELIWDRSFDPLELFAGGKQGVWYDPSDKLTLFQDAAGTIPVTKDGDPVGVILDKSQGLNHSDKTVPIFKAPEWSVIDKQYIKLVGNKVMFNIPSEANMNAFSDLMYTLFFFELGKRYKITFDIKNYVSGNIRPQAGGLSFGDFVSGDGSHTFTMNIPASANRNFIFKGSEYPLNLTLENLKVTEIKGNHAAQSLSVARPVYKTVNAMAWLFNDKIDDKMLVGLPTMTATVIKATDEGVSINYPVSITAGDYPITSTSALGRDYGHLIINRELSVSEITQVTNYFNTKRGV